MKRLVGGAAILACMADVDLNPIRADWADSPEGHQQVTIGQRPRTFDGERVDTSSWLAVAELARATTGLSADAVEPLRRPPTVVSSNRICRETAKSVGLATSNR